MRFAILCFVFLFALLGGYEMNQTTPSVWMVVLIIVVGAIGLGSGHKSIGRDGKIVWDHPRYEDHHMSSAWLKSHKRDRLDPAELKPGYPDLMD